MLHRTSPLIYYVAGAASLGACSLLYSALTSSNPKPRILSSPLSTYDASSLAQSPYPPSDYIPGARDVPTPYGTIRIYEFGPIDSTRKVLLIHGISTPCISVVGIASALAEKGCRVMLLDLFGRGWSDAPADLHYDDRLYASQLFMALASSPISWTGGSGGGFTIIGFSMGAAIAANFTSWFPALVEDLVLIAPAGLIRPEHRDWKTRLMYSGVLPDWIIASLVKNRLRTNPNVKTTTKAKTDLPVNSASDPLAAEVTNTSTSASVAFGRPIDAEAVVRWQMDHHAGFIPAFFSSFVDAPVRGQHDRWRLIGMRLDAQRAAAKVGEAASAESAARERLRAGKVLMVLGKTDRAVFSDELEPDAKAVFGDANMEVKVFDAGHEVPITFAKEISDWIWDQWGAVR
jgi:pimeloyl-ACP methyl ester carboxylesterase